ncbi:MAG TPA: hypothetical protein PK133_11780 [Ferruginibacter sp.]|nr:hypothetical protein [Chitinophagaceae bacterium]HQY12890.1 hypothetical protein [Ferruginibacter sp.]
MLQRTATITSLCILLLASCVSYSSGEHDYMRPVYVYPGVGLGTIIAVVISWSRNKSVLWAIVHGFFGWLYVIYALIVGTKKDQ